MGIQSWAFPTGCFLSPMSSILAPVTRCSWDFFTSKMPSDGSFAWPLSFNLFSTSLGPQPFEHQDWAWAQERCVRAHFQFGNEKLVVNTMDAGRIHDHHVPGCVQWKFGPTSTLTPTPTPSPGSWLDQFDVPLIWFAHKFWGCLELIWSSLNYDVFQGCLSCQYHIWGLYGGIMALIASNFLTLCHNLPSMTKRRHTFSVTSQPVASGGSMMSVTLRTAGPFLSLLRRVLQAPCAQRMLKWQRVEWISPTTRNLWVTLAFLFFFLHWHFWAWNLSMEINNAARMWVKCINI